MPVILIQADLVAISNIIIDRDNSLVWVWEQMERWSYSVSQSPVKWAINLK